MRIFYGFYVNVKPNEVKTPILLRIKMEMQLKIYQLRMSSPMTH